MRFLKSQKGFAPVLILVIVVVVAGLVGGGIFLKSKGELHNIVPIVPHGFQRNNDPIMQALGCSSQQSCMQFCSQPQNQAKCQQVFQQYGGSNGRGGPSLGGSNQQGDFAMAGNNGDTSTASLPDCPSNNALFDHWITDSNAYTGIEPLGHMNGQHILPDQADHVYINMVRGSSGYSQQTDVFSPGNVVLLQAVKKSSYAGQNANITDYLLEFSPCKSVIFTLDHVRNLNDKIMSALAGKTPTCQQGGTEQACTYPDLSVNLSSGEKVGIAGGLETFSLAFDFAGADVRTKPLSFIDTGPAAQTGVTASSYYHAVCPLDYFNDSLKSELYSKLTIKNAGANGIPACGTTMQDLPGSAQGNWYHQGSTKSYQGLNLQGALAIAHSNLDPSIGVISSGTDLIPSNDFGSQIDFQPKSNGYINREPSQIKADGHVYCFDGPILSGGGGGEAHVDIQLIDGTNMKADYAAGACSSNPSLGNTVIYSR